MGAPASTECVMDIILQLFSLEAIVPDSSSSSGNKRNVDIWFSQFVWEHFLHFSFIMPKISLNSKVFSIFLVPWNFISNASVLCHQPIINASNILSPFLGKIHWFWLRHHAVFFAHSFSFTRPLHTVFRTVGFLPASSQPSLDTLFLDFEYYLCVDDSQIYVVFPDFSPELQTLYPTTVWCLRMYTYQASQISNSWKRRSSSTPLCSFENGVSLVLAITTVNGTMASPNCSDLKPGCHLPFLVLHIPNPSNPSKDFTETFFIAHSLIIFSTVTLLLSGVRRDTSKSCGNTIGFRVVWWDENKGPLVLLGIFPCSVVIEAIFLMAWSLLALLRSAADVTHDKALCLVRGPWWSLHDSANPQFLLMLLWQALCFCRYFHPTPGLAALPCSGCCGMAIVGPIKEPWQDFMLCYSAALPASSIFPGLSPCSQE